MLAGNFLLQAILALYTYNRKAGLHCKSETMIQIEVLPKSRAQKFKGQFNKIKNRPIVKRYRYGRLALFIVEFKNNLLKTMESNMKPVNGAIASMPRNKLNKR